MTDPADKLVETIEAELNDWALKFEVHGMAKCVACALTEAGLVAETPIDMVLFCPACGVQHIDAPEVYRTDGFEDGTEGWTNPPHRSHLCLACGYIWRPADVATNGVAAVQTRGTNDSPAETQKAWTPIGWNGPFRITSIVVRDADGAEVCRAKSSNDAREIASALNTACQAGAVSEWRPIDDDTPRDGSIQIVTPGGDGYSWCAAQWGRDSIHSKGEVEGWWFNGCFMREQPTYWMPLPPPPETGGR